MDVTLYGGSATAPNLSTSIFSLPTSSALWTVSVALLMLCHCCSTCMHCSCGTFNSDDAIIVRQNVIAVALLPSRVRMLDGAGSRVPSHQLDRRLPGAHRDSSHHEPQLHLGSVCWRSRPGEGRHRRKGQEAEAVSGQRSSPLDSSRTLRKATTTPSTDFEAQHSEATPRSPQLVKGLRR